MYTKALTICLMFTYISQTIPPAETFHIDLDEVVKLMAKGLFDDIVIPVEVIGKTLPKLESTDSSKDAPENLPTPDELISFIPDFPHVKSRCPPGEDLLEDGSCLPPM